MHKVREIITSTNQSNAPVGHFFQMRRGPTVTEVDVLVGLDCCSHNAGTLQLDLLLESEA